jgi:hypothetical protein
MRMVTDPLLLAVALGMLNPTALQVDEDLMGDVTPPPMLASVLDAAPEASPLPEPTGT